MHCSVLGIETQTVDVDRNCNFLRTWYQNITTFKITKFLTSDSRDNLAAEGIKSLNDFMPSAAKLSLESGVKNF